MKYVFCFIFIAFMAMSLALGGCSWSAAGGARAETYYPDNWKIGGDPANSRAAGVDVAANSTPGRQFPIPNGGK